MTEERVTKTILKWLISKGWEIICYDFPQSGTGILLHPNGSIDKNKDTISPDIVAVKYDKCLFFENKSYFYYPDFEKIQHLRTTDDYSNDIDSLLSNHEVKSIKYGIGYPTTVHKTKAKESLHMIDFIIGITKDYDVEILYDEDGILQT